ncbi:MAG: L-serine ammonia-lyase, iron-sulfur-dependent, subunit alpha [Akkermansiaceae bacterium]|jgi:L-serine dehydratase|nr:L-serine ammonia-lyase, iron-sulfur-dependent, subunit alpha [Akkermansiaceae bacterium]
MIVSIFNDVIGPVMRGPSSSHCAAALRIGRLARDLMEARFSDVLVEFDRNGSLPTTHDTQGSDMGLFGGLMGWDAADPRLPDSPQALSAAGVRIAIETVDAGDPHPNTYRLTLHGSHGTRTLRAISTGGGMMEVIDLDGFAVSMFGDCYETLLWIGEDGDGEGVMRELQSRIDADEIRLHREGGRQLIEIKAPAFVSEPQLAGIAGIHKISRLGPVLPVLSRRGMAVPFGSCEEMMIHDAGRNTPLWKLAAEYEMARGGLSEAEVIEKMAEIIRILRRSIAEGIAGTEYADRVLGHQSGRFAELMRDGKLLGSGPLNRMVLYVTALMEVKSSMGVIVAAPTAGACAALPGALIAMAEEMGLDEEAMAKAMLASGLIGVFIATRWTFAAEVGGCQAEGGSAACMAAAGLVTLAGGTLTESVAAASMAFQSMIGLICDPVANRVEVPCLGKNVMAASNALSCANMAIAGFDPVIPLDEVIETAKQVARQMPRELRCTALGGLSITPTSLAIEQRLAEKRSGGCSTSCGCHG